VRGKLPLLVGKGDVIELVAASVGALSYIFSCYSKIWGAAGTGLADMLFAQTQPAGC
jgi:hypothetical protein